MFQIIFLSGPSLLGNRVCSHCRPESVFLASWNLMRRNYRVLEIVWPRTCLKRTICENNFYFKIIKGFEHPFLQKQIYNGTDCETRCHLQLSNRYRVFGKCWFGISASKTRNCGATTKHFILLGTGQFHAEIFGLGCLDWRTLCFAKAFSA